MKKIILVIFTLLIVDFISSNLIFKKMGFWHYDKLINHYWRIPSKIYHHDLKANIDVVEPWGFNLKKKLITNSLGFRDYTNKKISKFSDKKRLLLIGDSAIEGAGYDYEYTIGGLLQKHLEKNYEVLNSAVGSYSPSIYFKKIEYFINKGYVFDKAIIFLDPSDVIDELFIKYDDNNNIIVEDKKNVGDKVGDFLVHNFLTFRTILRFSDSAESLKNFLKLKHKASKKYKKSFFKTTTEDTLFYRMTHVDRSAWTFDNLLFTNYKEGLEKSEKNLNKLIKLLENNFIDINFVLYPHPSQIFYEDKYHQSYWIDWANKKNLKTINLYKNFNSTNNRKLILDTFIFGDLHWNKNGTEIVFQNLVKNINF